MMSARLRFRSSKTMKDLAEHLAKGKFVFRTLRKQPNKRVFTL